MNKVFGIGLSKTGTKTLAQALLILGYKVFHSPNAWDIYTYDGGTDTSVAVRYQELDKLFPDSKFILTVRNLEGWLKSFEKHSSKLNFADMPKHLRFEYEWLRVKLYGSIKFEPTLYAQGYAKHVQEVKAYFKTRPASLLILDICGGEKWDKLCPFLGKPVTNMPFPHENKTVY